MKSIKELSITIAETTNYDLDIVEYHAHRIARRFNYAVAKNGLVSNEDAKTISFVTMHSLLDHRKKEERKAPITSLMPVIRTGPEKNISALSNAHVPTHTKAIPIIEKARRKVFKKI